MIPSVGSTTVVYLPKNCCKFQEKLNDKEQLQLSNAYKKVSLRYGKKVFKSNINIPDKSGE